MRDVRKTIAVVDRQIAEKVARRPSLDSDSSLIGDMTVPPSILRRLPGSESED